jgi:hypothetical protein
MWTKAIRKILNKTLKDIHYLSYSMIICFKVTYCLNVNGLYGNGVRLL